LSYHSKGNGTRRDHWNEQNDLPPEAQFHEDIHLLVWRPHGLLNQAAVNKIITVIGELETTLNEPITNSMDGED
jgi:hypothetical protein